MKLSFLLQILFILILSTSPLSSFSNTITEDKDFKKWIDNQSHELISYLEEYSNNALLFEKGSLKLSTLKSNHQKAKNKYKEIEFILEFFYPKHAKEYLNGPPIAHIDPYPYKENNSGYYAEGAKAYMNTLPLDLLIEGGHYLTNSKVSQPKGFQVLDELIFGEDGVDKTEIYAQTKELLTKYKALQKGLNIRQVYEDFQIIEAARIELIRIFTLGITGFDTPSSLLGLNETSYALNGTINGISLIFDQTNTSYFKIIELNKNAQEFIQRNNNFNKFNRLQFLKEYINPIYKELFIYQQYRNLPTLSETTSYIYPWNSKSDNIFSENFLNPYFFTKLNEAENSTSIKQLGESLFFNPMLSNGGKVSCSSCHNPQKAFTDGLSKSKANQEGDFLDRNAPSLVNAIFSDRFFYDLRAHGLTEQINYVITAHKEFNTTFNEVIEKIKEDSVYTKQFSEAFKNKRINKTNITKAIESYLISITSINSPFDQYIRNEKKYLSPKIEKGFNLFMGKAKCGTCHYAPLFSGLVPPSFEEMESEVIGVLFTPEKLKVDSDLGRYENGISTDNEEIFRHSFKTPSIRTASLTSPYFHNGKYNSLKEVMDFYNKGGAKGMKVKYGTTNQTLDSTPLGLSNSEIKSIMKFIDSLSK